MRYEIAAGTIFMLRIWHCRENCNFESEEERGWCLISFLTALRQQNRQSCIHKMLAERTSTIQSAWPLLRRFAANIGSVTRAIDTETESSFPYRRPYSLAHATCSAAARCRLRHQPRFTIPASFATRAKQPEERTVG